MSNIRKANRGAKVKQSTDASKNKAYLGQHDSVSGEMLQDDTITGDKIQDSTIPSTKFANIGEVGDIKTSLLDEADFIAVHGSGWVLATGQDITGSQYHTITGRNVLPDMRGKFLRGAGGSGDYIGPTNPGDQQNDSMQGHKHSDDLSGSTNSQGNHNHTPNNGGDFVVAKAGYGGLTGVGSPNRGLDSTNYAGNHSHTVSISGAVNDPTTDGSNGTPRTDAETRPVNIGVNYFVKIN